MRGRSNVGAMRPADTSPEAHEVQLGILELRGGTLDLAYIEHWASEIGLSALWARVQREAAAS